DHYVECNGHCVAADTDRNNCGICGRTCKADEACTHGSCTCASGTRESSCTDGIDNDCDGKIDCADPDCVGTTKPCMGSCGPGVQRCQAGGSYAACEGGNGTEEICGDGIDQDCDGKDLRAPDIWEPNDTCDECALVDGTDPN